MSRKIEIVCDGCGEECQYTGNCEDWRLELANERLAPWFTRDGLRGGAVTSMALSPPVDRTHHFCGIPCLAKWLAEHHPDALDKYERLMAHRVWLRKSRAPEPDDA